MFSTSVLVTGGSLLALHWYATLERLIRMGWAGRTSDIFISAGVSARSSRTLFIFISRHINYRIKISQNHSISFGSKITAAPGPVNASSASQVTPKLLIVITWWTLLRWNVRSNASSKLFYSALKSSSLSRDCKASRAGLVFRWHMRLFNFRHEARTWAQELKH